MARLSVGIGHQTNTWYDEIGIYVQNVNIIWGSIMNTIGRTNVIIQRERQPSFSLGFDLINILHANFDFET